MNQLFKERLGISTLEDISALILQSHDLDDTLRNIVTLVAKRTGTDVCSIYLLDEDNKTLRLQASKGLSRRAVGKVTMQIGEGLTGLAAQKRHPVAIQEPQSHPQYRYFKETREERFHSFLGIPLFDRKNPLGVIVIQTKERRQFTPEEISTLSTIAFQVSSIVINARLLDSIRKKEEERQQIFRELKKSQSPIKQSEPPQETKAAALRGTVACPGVVSGPVHIMNEQLGFSDIFDEARVDIDEELQKLEAALEKTRIQTLYLEKRVAERLSPANAAIFHTHLIILEDQALLDKLYEEVQKGHSAPYSLKKVIGEHIEAFDRMEDPYLRERAADMEDIGRRLLGNFTGQESSSSQLKHPGILVAREILPSDMATLDHDKILGIVTEVGEQYSHAVIMAKSLGIPALTGVKGALKVVAPEDRVILDANSGCFYINPSEQIIEEYRRLEKDRSRELHRIEEFRSLPAKTKDGFQVTLRANIGLLSDMEVALRNGAEGVGLYRTEFPYMTRGNFPDRDDQYLLYRKVVEGFVEHSVTIRTLDIGGDKALPYFTHPKEDNPFMGWRSVRVSLDNREIFRTQVEAILMAGAHGPVQILFPMISGLDEVRACKIVIEEAKENLLKEGIPFAETVPFGVMVEVPAAIQLAPQLAREIDFFSLGTNDLIQYMLAADRNNPLVHKYYDPLHPAILHALNDVTKVALEQKKGLCLCGEMASDPLNFLLLMGLGIREFSMPAPFIPRIKAFLSDLPIDMAREAAQQSLTMTDSAQIRNHLMDVLKKIENIA